MKHFSHCTTFLDAYRRSLVLPLALAALAALSGCASLPPDLAAGGNVALERIDSHSAHVGSVSVRAADTAMTVSGMVTRRHGQRGPIPGHLHIEAIGDGDVSLAKTTSSYHRRSVKARKARFSDTLAANPRDIRKIRVTHHGLSHKSC